jgi:Sulfotransferase domain
MKSLAFFFCLLVLQSLESNCLMSLDDTTDKQANHKDKEFYVITVPKSGSHLLLKLIVMLTNRYPNGMHSLYDHLDQVSEKEFEKIVLKCQDENHFAFNHTADFGALFNTFSKHHPEYTGLLMIRDLRDVLVSYVYHVSDSLEEQFGPSLTMEEKLTLVLDLETFEVSKKMEQEVLSAIEWMNRPNVIVCRFENIVGPMGGGDLQKQIESITHLARTLGMDLTQEYLEKILQDLFGNSQGPTVSGTFRSGQIGSWKNLFTAEHEALFLKHWNAYQIQLGYP